VDTKQKEAACVTLLSIASRDLKEGRYLHALTIFRALSKIDFSWQQVALQGEAVSLVRMGEFKGTYAEAERMFKSLVNTYDKATVSKADTLAQLAEVSIGLEHTDDVDGILKEAADIYFEQGLTKANGSIVHLQGLVALTRGNVEEALEKFNWATALSEIKVPEIVPSGFGIEAPPEIYNEPSSRRALAGAMR
jgi:tetratricopeptide (TPR) repeat protein